jgi:hypothetical protein
MNPDSACSSITVTITPTYADNYAKEFYRINPQMLTLAPGEFGTIEVSFTAPTQQRLDEILVARGHVPQTVADSTFSVKLQIQGAGCLQNVDIAAVVTSIPDVSPIINLRAYAQKTNEKPDPEHEVYFFGAGSRTIIITGEYPPMQGHIYIDVDNNNFGAPPQEPILKLVPGSGVLGMKIWRRAYLEDDFYNVRQLIDQFQNDASHTTGYGAELTGLNVRDVIAFKLTENIYTLIYIRRVDNGTESTSSKQSGIEFRAVAGIFVY